MVSSKSSQVRLFLFAILASSLYTKSTLGAHTCCRPGETHVVSPYQSRGCDELFKDCIGRCAKQGRITVFNECQKLLLLFQSRCEACCAVPPPPPPPPFTGTGCLPAQTSLSWAVPNCLGCKPDDCSNKCAAVGETMEIGLCNLSIWTCICCCTNKNNVMRHHYSPQQSESKAITWAL